MKISFLFLVLISCTSLASESVLLVAHKNTSFEDYKKICTKNNYLCFPQAFILINKSKTPHFNFLIENFDLDNKTYVTEFSEKLSLSLKEDDLTLEQIKNLILATEKLAPLKDSKLSIQLVKLKKMYSVLTSIPEEKADRIIYIAGKSIANTLSRRLQLDTYLEELNHYEIDYVSVVSSKEKRYFLNGDCNYPRYSEVVSQADLHVIPHFSEGCDLNQKYSWGKDLMMDHFQENKNKYFIGLAALATMFFLKSYEISTGNE